MEKSTLSIKSARKEDYSKLSPTTQPTQINKPCYCCGKTNHQPAECRYKSSTCNYCKLTGQLETACQKKKMNDSKPLKVIRTLKTMNTVPQLQVYVTLQCQPFQLEVDTGARDNFLSLENWKRLRSSNFQSQHILETRMAVNWFVKNTCGILASAIELAPMKVVNLAEY